MKRFLFALLAATLASPAVAAEGTRLLRFPAVHGDTVVFTYASDLWAADRKGGAARRLTAHRGDERRPSISPDGTRIAFLASYDGDPDLYVMPIDGGMPRRLTFDSITENLAGWTPDGKIAYASTAGNFTNRQPRLWLLSPEGGLPTPTPLLEFATGSFFPGGQRLAYNRTATYGQNWRRYRGGNAGRISLYDFATGTYSELPLPGGGPESRANSWHPLVIGGAIYYASDRGTADHGTVNLYRHDLATGQDTQLTHHGDADVRWPSTDGKTIVYEHDGYLRAYDVAAAPDERLAIEVRGDGLAARPYLLKVGKQIGDMALAPGGARILIEARGEIFDLAVKGKDARNLTATPGARERSPRWSPDGKTIAYLSDASGEYQVYTRPSAGGEPRQVSEHTGAGIRGLSWSPDGKRLAYWNEEARLFVLDPQSRQSREVFRTEYQPDHLTFDWSPDGRWIAFSAPRRNGFNALSLYEVETGRTTQVTDGFYDDRNVRFDLSGKYLYFTSARTFNPTGGRFELSLKVEDADRVYVVPLAKDLPNPLFPKEVKVGGENKDAKDSKDSKDGKDKAPQVRIDLEGLAGRAVLLPFPAGEAGELFAGKEAVYHYDYEKLRKFDLASQEVVTIYEGPEIDLAFEPDRTRLAYFANGANGANSTLGVAEVKPGIKNGDGKVDLDAVETWVDPQAEWRQILWEAWRFERDNFFREDMAGLDWPAVGRHYETYLPHVSHWSDFQLVLGLMLGELGTSHAYVEAPADETTPEERKAKAALLGADYESDGKWVRFQRIYPGTLTQDSLRGPLGEPGLNVKPGDYLLAIDGQPLENTHPGALLINKADRVVTLTVNDRPTREGARDIRVRPVASEANLRYYEWVEENRRKVAEMSGGRIGYIHYPNTGVGGQTEFIRSYFAQTDKDAVILDGRFNSGGFPQPMVLPTLGRRQQTVVRYRKWQAGSEVTAIDGPKAMLINGYAGSGGDLTPWMFRDAGMGVLIGTRTLGALVGIEEYRGLMGGGNVSAPGYTRFDPRTGAWIAENRGIEPDIEVDARPDLLAQGRDPQLEKAVEHLLDQLAKNPPRVAEPQLPPPPAWRAREAVKGEQ